MSNTQQWADALESARSNAAPIAPLSEAGAQLTVEDAYAVQQELTSRLLASGSVLTGYKLGLTSEAMRASLGIDEPDFGPVLSTLTIPSGSSIDLQTLIQPRIEAEIGLYLREPLAGPGVSLAQAEAAIESAQAVLEIVDSRIVDWRIGLIDTVADLASTALVVSAPVKVPIEEFEPRLCGMAIYRNSKLVATAAGAEALGDPVAAVAWLANRLGSMGTTLERGHLVLTGALHAAFPLATGDEIEAEFDHLGSVRVSVSEVDAG